MSPDTCLYYLGPQGTFTNQAAEIALREGERLEPKSTVAEVIDAVESDSSARGVVPIENSVHGEVTTTMDALLFDTENVYINGEVVVPVSFSAMAARADLPSAPTVLSHPHALAQCQQFILQLGADARATSSTAEACRIVSQTDEPLIALAASNAAEEYNLRIISTQVEDHPGAATRFLVLGQSLPPITGDDKTSLVVIPPDDRTGALVRFLLTFSDRHLNLNSIHSRPTKSNLGTYCFVLSIEGHVREDRPHAAIHDLLSRGHRVKLLGSYPAWAGHDLSVPFHAIPGLLKSPSAFDKLLDSALSDRR